MGDCRGKEIISPSVELVEIKVVLPKIVWDRFKDPHTFLGLDAKITKSHSTSKRLSRFMLNYHKLVTNKEATAIKEFLDRKDVTKALAKYSNGECDFETMLKSIVA